MIQGLLLAGGTGRRFGGGKLAHPLPGGIPIVRQAALNLLSSLPAVLVIHRPGDRALMDALEGLPLRLCACHQCEAGMGASLAAAVQLGGQADGWVVALGDMPWISPASIDRVRDALLQGASIAVPHVGGRPGHPVGFSSVWGPSLSALQGDRGARALLETHAAVVQRVEVDDPGILRDVDVRADLPSG